VYRALAKNFFSGVGFLRHQGSGFRDQRKLPALRAASLDDGEDAVVVNIRGREAPGN
jgi:hypothetical protein